MSQLKQAIRKYIKEEFLLEERELDTIQITMFDFDELVEVLDDAINNQIYEILGEMK